MVTHRQFSLLITEALHTDFIVNKGQIDTIQQGRVLSHIDEQTYTETKVISSKQSMHNQNAHTHVIFSQQIIRNKNVIVRMKRLYYIFITCDLFAGLIGWCDRRYSTNLSIMFSSKRRFHKTITFLLHLIRFIVWWISDIK